MFSFTDLTPHSPQLVALVDEALAMGRACVASAIIIDQHDRAFVQRRAPHRLLFPSCWDIVGGHVEPGETLDEAFAREVVEETGWSFNRLLHLIAIVDWEAEDDEQGIGRREFCFHVEVPGDLERPRLERDKVTEFRCVGRDELDILREHRAAGDTVIYDLVRRALAHGSR